MDAEQLMAHLEKKGTAQARKIYLRHGSREPMFGVSFAELNALKKKIKVDHALAKSLWASGNADAMILAAMIADPAQMTRAEAKRWVKETDFRGLRDYVGCLLAHAPDSEELLREFVASRDANERQIGFAMMGEYGKRGTAVPTEISRAALACIERDIHTADNWSRYAMMYTLIGIGGWSSTLTKDAIAAAKRIGKVDFDPEETSCKMPDPVPYIQKMAAHAAKKKKAA